MTDLDPNYKEFPVNGNHGFGKFRTHYHTKAEIWAKEAKQKIFKDKKSVATDSEKSIDHVLADFPGVDFGPVTEPKNLVINLETFLLNLDKLLLKQLRPQYTAEAIYGHFQFGYLVDRLIKVMDECLEKNILASVGLKDIETFFNKIFFRNGRVDDFIRCMFPISSASEFKMVKKSVCGLADKYFGYWIEDDSTCMEFPSVKIYFYRKGITLFGKIATLEVQIVYSKVLKAKENAPIHILYEIERLSKFQKAKAVYQRLNMLSKKTTIENFLSNRYGFNTSADLEQLQGGNFTNEKGEYTSGSLKLIFAPNFNRSNAPKVMNGFLVALNSIYMWTERKFTVPFTASWKNFGNQMIMGISPIPDKHGDKDSKTLTVACFDSLWIRDQFYGRSLVFKQCSSVKAKAFNTFKMEVTAELVKVKVNGNQEFETKNVYGTEFHCGFFMWDTIKEYSFFSNFDVKTE